LLAFLKFPASPFLRITPLRMPHTKFYGSQVGGEKLTVHSYTGSPLKLLRHDVLCALQFFMFLPFIVWPLKPHGSRELCELYPSAANLWAMFLHLILCFMQLPFILSVPFWVFFPVWWVLGCVTVFMVVTQGICYLLNGSRMEYPSNPKYAEAKKEHEHEQWIFLNGVAVGWVILSCFTPSHSDSNARKHWLQGNVDRLALTFGRPVLGVHNKTLVFPRLF
jgi:hypothetical protein